MAIVGFRHVGLKVVSIALAALLWLVVSGEQIVERALGRAVERRHPRPVRPLLVGHPCKGGGRALTEERPGGRDRQEERSPSGQVRSGSTHEGGDRGGRRARRFRRDRTS